MILFAKYEPLARISCNRYSCWSIFFKKNSRWVKNFGTLSTIVLQQACIGLTCVSIQYLNVLTSNSCPAKQLFFCSKEINFLQKSLYLMKLDSILSYFCLKFLVGWSRFVKFRYFSPIKWCPQLFVFKSQYFLGNMLK